MKENRNHVTMIIIFFMALLTFATSTTWLTAMPPAAPETTSAAEEEVAAEPETNDTTPVDESKAGAETEEAVEPTEEAVEPTEEAVEPTEEAVEPTEEATDEPEEEAKPASKKKKNKKDAMPEADEEPDAEPAPEDLEELEEPYRENTEKDKEEDVTESEEQNIYLNFDNTELSNFINYMADLKKINLIPDKSLEGNKVSLTIREPLTVDGAWNIFLTVLEMAGFSIINVGDVHKIVPKDQKLTQPLPSYINVPADSLPDSDLLIRYVIFLENIKVESLTDLLKSMLSTTSDAIAQNDVNGFIITDKAYNIKAAVKLIQELDQAGELETVEVIRLKQANAEDVKTLLNSLIEQPEGGAGALARLLGKTSEGTTKYFPAGTKIIAEPRTNSIILMGAPGPIKKIEEFIINNVDTTLKSAASPLHIFELQYADATQIAEILQTVTAPPEGGPGQQATQYGAIRGGVKYFKSMKFSVDKEGNRLIVSSTDKEDWHLLKKTIQDLDKPQPQIAVETYIVSVNAEDVKGLGGMLRNKKHGQIGNHIDFQSAPLTGNSELEYDSASKPVSLLGNLLNQLVANQGASLLTIGKASNIWSVFQAINQVTNATILTQPFLTVANKKKASLAVGRTVRVIQEQAGDAKGYTPIDASTKIDVEPQINLDGIIKMNISTTIEDFTNETQGNKQIKKLDTNVTIADGQVLVLGGFVQTKVEESNAKTPLLGDIPIVGWLFKNQNRKITRTYIFIFMCPTIIKPRQLPGMELYTKMKLHDVTKDIEESIQTTHSRDPIFNWFFNPKSGKYAENYSHKVIDFANARYQPTTVDIRNDSFYRTHTQREERAGSDSDEDLVNPEQALAEKTRTSMPESAINTQEKLVEEPTPPATPRQRTPQPEEQSKEIAKKKTLVEQVEKSEQKPRKSMMSDRTLETRRKKLKNIISEEFAGKAPKPAKKNAVKSALKNESLKEFIAPQSKREQLKKVLDTENITSVANQASPEPETNQLKRRSLKEFFSQNQPIKRRKPAPTDLEEELA
ncbi:hypothetical protein K2X40_05185 [Candidatus Babeliales bacterium]|nr:hypothetical protein [Candidatus Babeliales bacterium]